MISACVSKRLLLRYVTVYLLEWKADRRLLKDVSLCLLELKADQIDKW